MEAGGAEPPEPPSPAVGSRADAEEGNADRGMLESSLPDNIEAAKPLDTAEEMVGILASTDCLPKDSGAPSETLQMVHRGEQKPGASGASGCRATKSSPLRRPLWGEEMSGVPNPQSSPLNWNGASKAPGSRREEHSWNPGSSLPSGTHEAISAFLSSCWSELKTEPPSANNLSKPSQQDSGESEVMATEDMPPNGGEASDTKKPHWGGGKPESVGSNSPPAGPTEDDDPVVLAMFHAVANSRLPVRSQQKDEPDFTPAQKLAILRDLYHSKPLVFLERFRTVLREEHLPCFRHLSGSYEADFYCAEVRRAGLGKTRHTRVRNKRYAALQQLIQGGEYFSDEQMRSREPLLYEQYIGQYLSDEEMQALGSSKLEASCSLSGVLLDSYQEQVIQRRLQVQQEQEEACEEEEEEDSDDEDKASDLDMDEWVPEQEEKAYLREEFTSRMYQRFLDGKDRDFNYSEVDENPDFDNLDIVSRDEEERYFDGEDPEDVDAMEAE
uniref:Coiled-coil domain containing 97 n=1 Tax=Podarcis muralis TaxID=64176 RepID=A0A670IMC6_PODMU|nr:coiled-coil domain-containing protein 97 [Podarcis muralis]